MYYGWASLCLTVRDLAASTRFYEALGMELQPDASLEGQRSVLRSGTFRLALIVGIEENCLNLRGADVFAVHEALAKSLPDLDATPERYRPSAANRADSAGECLWIVDPDGNGVFFDTNQSEQGEAFKRARTAQILRDAEHELIRLDANAECLEVLRTQLIDRFCHAD